MYVRKSALNTQGSAKSTVPQRDTVYVQRQDAIALGIMELAQQRIRWLFNIRKDQTSSLITGDLIENVRFVHCITLQMWDGYCLGRGRTLRCFMSVLVKVSSA